MVGTAFLWPSKNMGANSVSQYWSKIEVPRVENMSADLMMS